MWQQGRESGKGGGGLDGRSLGGGAACNIHYADYKIERTATWKMQQFCTF